MKLFVFFLAIYASVPNNNNENSNLTPKSFNQKNDQKNDQKNEYSYISYSNLSFDQNQINSNASPSINHKIEPIIFTSPVIFDSLSYGFQNLSISSSEEKFDIPVANNNGVQIPPKKYVEYEEEFDILVVNNDGRFLGTKKQSSSIPFTFVNPINYGSISIKYKMLNIWQQQIKETIKFNEFDSSIDRYRGNVGCKDSSIYVNDKRVNGNIVPFNAVKFYATQAPMENTIIDYFEMIISEKIKLIVKLASDVDIGIQDNKNYIDYFAENTKDYKVIHNFESQSGFSIHNVFIEKDGQEIHKFKCLSFGNQWPDNEVPSVQTYKNFYSIYESMANTDKVLVHCNAGLGRTGVFIAIDAIKRNLYAFGQNDDGKYENVLETVKYIRNYRPYVVMNLQQYEFIHQVLYT